MDDRFVLVRSDTHAALSVVSGDYQIVQPREVLDFYRELMDRHGYALETAGALDGGRKVWALARTGVTGTADTGGKDKLAAYVLLATSCDKTLATTAAFTSIRVVCNNTLFFAMDDVKAKRRPQVKVPHNLRFNADRVKRELGLMDKAWSGFIEQVRKMAGYPMKSDAASFFVEDLLLPKDSKSLSNKAQREHKTIVDLFKSAPGQDLDSAKETLWGAVNAVTYYVDHVRSTTPGDRLDSAWFGAGYTLKEEAWVTASALVARS
jgi:phage/plasmid-like protein (TIGR03299 family)